MKTLIATAIVALSFAAPAAADKSAQAFFALNNDSAAERIVNPSAGANGTVPGAAADFALYNDSAAERNFVDTSTLRRRAPVAGGLSITEIQQKFALDNDSAAERIVK